MQVPELELPADKHPKNTVGEPALPKQQLCSTFTQPHSVATPGTCPSMGKEDSREPPQQEEEDAEGEQEQQESELGLGIAESPAAALAAAVAATTSSGSRDPEVYKPSSPAAAAAVPGSSGPQPSGVREGEERLLQKEQQEQELLQEVQAVKRLAHGQHWTVRDGEGGAQVCVHTLTRRGVQNGEISMPGV